MFHRRMSQEVIGGRHVPAAVGEVCGADLLLQQPFGRQQCCPPKVAGVDDDRFSLCQLPKLWTIQIHMTFRRGEFDVRAGMCVDKLTDCHGLYQHNSRKGRGKLSERKTGVEKKNR